MLNDKLYRNMIQISPHFSLQEFASKDTGEVMLDQRLLKLLEKLRSYIGNEIIINSGYRTSEHNKEIGGAKNSFHMKGMAADIWSPAYPYDELGRVAKSVGFPRVFMYVKKRFCHVDVAPGDVLTKIEK